MTILSMNKTFYPTPRHIGRLMVEKIKNYPKKVLEPSAGRGDLIDIMRNWHRCEFEHVDICAIEIDKDLRSILRGKQAKVIDTDFLAFSGPDKFDLIIANPPFDNGHKHLLKAIEIMYSGQIIFLLNAETIKNSFSNSRKLLVRKLEELNAEIEYIPNAFHDAERKTDVEVALVNIVIDRKVEDDIFAGCDDTINKFTDENKASYEVSTGKGVYELVAEYNQIVGLCTETIVGYYKNYRKVGNHLALNKEPSRYGSTDGNMTEAMQALVNSTLKTVREEFWRKTLQLREVKSRMTSKKLSQFEHLITDRCNMDFTENNIRNFILNLIDGYEKTLTEAVLDIFDMFTIRHTWDDDNHWEKNIHYFNGWKTNKAFKVGTKVVIPIYGNNYNGSSFWDPGYGANQRWKLSYEAPKTLNDIDIVMNYFDGMSPHYMSLAQAINKAFAETPQRTSNIQSTYFKATVHKKGTIHLTFRDEDVLRRFNVCACKGKGWLPCDYGVKAYKELSYDSQQVVDSFEGEQSYQENLGKPLFGNYINFLQIEYKEAEAA